MIRYCPKCGHEMTAESIGWKCRGCRGFVDMQGNFHEHKEKPFMPPPTNADRIRAMSDEELAKFLECFGLCYCCTEHHRLGDLRIYADEKCDEKCVEHCLEWLKQPAEE